MSASKILALSLVLNAAAVAGVAYVWKNPPSHPSASGTQTPSTSPAAKDSAKSVSSMVANATGTSGAAEFHWSRVETEDYVQYIANLRSVGCPEETIKDIIIADINKLYAPRFAALSSAARPVKYWEGRNNWGQSEEDVERNKQRTALEEEKAALIKQLLGIDYKEEVRKTAGYIDYLERQYPFLDKEKREQLQKITQKFSEMEQAVYRKSEGRVEAEDEAELKKIRDQRRAELAQVLTPQELFEYELRSSQTASQMKYDLGAFDPSEAEFRKIFEFKSAFDNQYGRNYGYGDEDPETRKARMEAQKKLDEQLKATLGDRYADYQKSQDYSFRELARIAKRYDLPKESADKVYAMKATAEQQAAKLRNDSSLTSEQRQAAMAAIQAETKKAITDTLGDRGLKSYLRSGGYWINNLSPQISR
ncbi:MAG TPA: hypothetical protein VK968_09205 [Roseimicrobium sp.]|nr:hypothetical protein [Roseimicrobium sp.]